jgi:hypothetical protein
VISLPVFSLPLVGRAGVGAGSGTAG